MYRKRSLCLIVAGAATVFACSSEKSRPPSGSLTNDMPRPTFGSGGMGSGGGDMGSGGGDMGSGGGDMGSGGSEGTVFGLPGSPTVALLAPQNSTDGTTTYKQEVAAICQVKKSTEMGAADFDASSVSLELRDDNDMLIEEKKPSFENSQFEGSFSLTSLEHGKYSLRCVASDKSARPLWGKAENKILVDKGPIILPISPINGAAMPAEGVVRFEFRVSPVELFPGDSGAKVDQVFLQYKDHKFPAALKAGETDIYTVNVNLGDTTIFMSPPNGLTALSLTATNSRDTPVETTQELGVYFDGKGPVVTLTSHNIETNPGIIGGKTVLEFEVADDGQVDWETFTVTLNSTSVTYDESAKNTWKQTGLSKITYTFDTTEVKGTVREIGINVQVSDTAGNPSSALGGVFYRDEEPPIFDLEPPNFRATKKSGSDHLCSHSFDPVGTKALHNGDKSSNFGWFRTIAWDQASSTSGQSIFHYSHVDETSVKFVISKASDAPLITDTKVDKDGKKDGICDTVELAHASPHNLFPLKVSAGSPFYGDGTGDSSTPALNGCKYSTETAVPETLCGGASDLQYVSHHNADGIRAEAVYGVTPSTSGTFCTGKDLELAAQELDGYEGWICMAAYGKDRVGNEGVSAPIAICYNNIDIAGEPSCWSGSETPPDCTDGCTPIRSKAMIVREE